MPVGQGAAKTRSGPLEAALESGQYRGFDMLLQADQPSSTGFQDADNPCPRRPALHGREWLHIPGVAYSSLAFLKAIPIQVRAKCRLIGWCRSTLDRHD